MDLTILTWNQSSHLWDLAWAQVVGMSCLEHCCLYHSWNLAESSEYELDIRYRRVVYLALVCGPGIRIGRRTQIPAKCVLVFAKHSKVRPVAVDAPLEYQQTPLLTPLVQEMEAHHRRYKGSTVLAMKPKRSVPVPEIHHCHNVGVWNKSRCSCPSPRGNRFAMDRPGGCGSLYHPPDEAGPKYQDKDYSKSMEIPVSLDVSIPGQAIRLHRSFSSRIRGRQAAVNSIPGHISMDCISPAAMHVLSMAL